MPSPSWARTPAPHGLGLHTLWCRKNMKKSSHFRAKSRKQRIGILCPARSMVLKVVRGKILETLELSLSAEARGAVLELPMAGAVVRLLKNAIILQITSTLQYYRE